MCRLFAYNGKIDEEYRQALGEFSKLAVSGCVPCGIPAGHQDGWGIHSANNHEEFYFRSLEKIESQDLSSLIPFTSDTPIRTIMHLRKATVGANMLCNTHPFIHAGISFCHNGSIKAFQETSFTEGRIMREGHTDSETFFVRVLQRISGEVGDASLDDLKNVLEAEIAEIKNTSEWTSLTCLLQSKEGIILKYLWNEKHPDSLQMEFKKYYTFYIGRKNDTTIFCSEKLLLEGFVWEKLNNDTLLKLAK